MKNQVMIVDDEPHILAGLKDLLEAEGYQVVVASSGEECLSALEKGFKGLILLDIVMPDMNGWDTIRKMMVYGWVEGNLIAMLTARDAPDPQVEELGAYVADYIIKPFDPQKLLEIVKEYMTFLE